MSKKLTVYHVCGLSKLFRYLQRGVILPPVRAWTDIQAAERFSRATGRPIILVLKFDIERVRRLEGHSGKAVFIQEPYNISKRLGFVKGKHKI